MVVASIRQVRQAALDNATRNLAACKSEQSALMESFTRADQFYGQFVDMISRRVSSLSRKVKTLEDVQRRMEYAYNKAAMQDRSAEESLFKAQAEAVLEEEKGELERALDHFVLQGRGKSTASL